MGAMVKLTVYNGPLSGACMCLPSALHTPELPSSGSKSHLLEGPGIDHWPFTKWMFVICSSKLSTSYNRYGPGLCVVAEMGGRIESSEGSLRV